MEKVGSKKSSLASKSLDRFSQRETVFHMLSTPNRLIDSAFWKCCANEAERRADALALSRNLFQIKRIHPPFLYIKHRKEEKRRSLWEKKGRMRKSRATIAILNVNKCVIKNSSKPCRIFYFHSVNNSIRLFCVCVFFFVQLYKSCFSKTVRTRERKQKKNVVKMMMNLMPWIKKMAINSDATYLSVRFFRLERLLCILIKCIIYFLLLLL